MTIQIESGVYRFEAELLTHLAPRTCERFLEALPLGDKIIHVRWSGEACWIPFGDRDFGVSYENATSFPAPGDVLLYPGGFSETEIIIGYGAVRFASKMGSWQATISCRSKATARPWRSWAARRFGRAHNPSASQRWRLETSHPRVRVAYALPLNQRRNGDSLR